MQEIEINIKDTQVEPYSISMIGVNINSKLSFVDHVCEVCKTCEKSGQKILFTVRLLDSIDCQVAVTL